MARSLAHDPPHLTLSASQTELIARIIRGMYDRALSSVVVKPAIMDSYNAFLNQRLQQTSLASPECGSSWYKDPETGKLVAPAPWGASKSRVSSLAADDALVLIRPTFIVELWTYTRKIRWEHWLCRRWEPSPDAAERKAVVVPVQTPRTWTPWGLFMDWLALRVRARLVRLMTEVKDGREKGEGRVKGGEVKTPTLITPEEYLA